jgi:hypothetical protein
MGRADSHPGNEPEDRNGNLCNRMSLRRIRLNSGGYDAGGAYWGIGAPLYWAGDESGNVSIFFRAASRGAAKDHVGKLWPDATFWR